MGDVDLDTSPGFWLGVLHRADPNSPHLSPDNPPTGFSPAFRHDWIQGWKDADWVAREDGFEALQEYGKEADWVTREIEEMLFRIAGGDDADG